MRHESEKPLLSIEDLVVTYRADEGAARAVDGVSLSIRRGESWGLVGESGCGKSTVAMSIPRLIPCPPGRIERGRVFFDGRDLLQESAPALRALRGRRIGMIFQEPMTALSPLHRIGDQLIEAIRLHEPAPRSEAGRRAVDWLGKVGLPDPARQARALPHELSGGMRQRVMIAMALLHQPDLLIADEPTTALDVTVQAQVLALMQRMKGERSTLLLITHDLGVVWHMCAMTAVMYAGELVEIGPTRAILSRPFHPYTEALLKSMPADAGSLDDLKPIPGQAPPANAYPPGCRFHPRCPYALPACRERSPEWTAHASGRLRCLRAAERMGAAS